MNKERRKGPQSIARDLFVECEELTDLEHAITSHAKKSAAKGSTLSRFLFLELLIEITAAYGDSVELFHGSEILPK